MDEGIVGRGASELEAALFGASRLLLCREAIRESLAPSDLSRVSCCGVKGWASLRRTTSFLIDISFSCARTRSESSMKSTGRAKEKLAAITNAAAASDRL